MKNFESLPPEMRPVMREAARKVREFGDQALDEKERLARKYPKLKEGAVTLLGLLSAGVKRL